MRFNDALIGAVLIVLAAAIAAYARTLPAIPGQDYGAAVFPMLVACGLGGCGVLLVLSGARNWTGAFAGAAWTRSRRAWGNVLITIGLVLFYIFAAGTLGFVPVSTIVLFGLFVMMGTRWWVAALVAVAVTLVIGKSFADLLLVPLPRGLFWL